MNTQPSYAGHRYHRDIISHAVWLYHRFILSFRDVEEILLSRGIDTTYESVWQWCLKFGSQYAKRIKSSRVPVGDIWYLDEVFIKINGKQHFLWSAVDQDGDVIDILVQKKRDRKAAKRFFRKLSKVSGGCPNQIVTDKLRSYGAAMRELNIGAVHNTDKYSNNRAENSHQRTRQQERQMRRFKSIGQAQRFLSVQGAIQNMFSIGRHLRSANGFRELRARAFNDWKMACQFEPSCA